MHADSPVDNWWTPTRVRALLARYPELALCADGLRAVAYQPFESHGSPPGEGRFCSALQCKADLDRAIAHLPARLRRVAVVYWCEAGDAVNIAHDLRRSERQAWALVGQAEQAIAESLCGDFSKQAPPSVSISNG